MRLADRVERLARAAAARGSRALLVIETAADDSPRPARPGGDRRSRGSGRAADRAHRLGARLGTENERLVHDARQGLDSALLAAEAGTIPAGGALLLLVGPLPPDGTSPPGSRFSARFARLLHEHLVAEPEISARTTLSIDAADTLVTSALAATGRTRSAGGTIGGAIATGEPTDEPCGAAIGGPAGAPPYTSPAAESALSEQDALLERALAHLERATRPLIVIEAPRGHGKSALLGRMAARLAASGIPCAACAARRSAIDVLERHRRGETSTDRDASLLFLPPDAALERGGDTLLVDEAASLPLPVLERLLGCWRRVVLATTSAGYESAGRAFALRLPATLDRERPGWLRLTPSTPMRWRAGDPLDALLARVNLSVATLAEPSARSRTGLERLPARRVDRDALAGDEPRLTKLFGLLTATHYQSTPLDLAHLLDGDGMALWSIERDGDVLATALVAIEPGIEPHLHADVLARRRRLPHRLLPQLLAQSGNRGDALAATCARVVRVAVHPAARRRGLGSRLVAAIVRDTAGEVEAVGASFGETPTTSAFWSSNGFTPFHRGHRRNPRSGRHSLAVLRAGSARTTTALAAAADIHRENASAHGTTDTGPLSERDVVLLGRLANGERGLSDTLSATWRLVRHVGGGRHAGETDVEDDAHRLLIALGLSAPPSRRAREARLRAWVRERLDAAR